MAKRTVRAIQIAGIVPNEVTAAMPHVLIVDPATLLIEDDYQRSLSTGSVKLIRKIVSGWDWARFKPPVVAQTDDGLEVIDGQHTAIAAATHPMIKLIPVIVVEAAAMEDRARAFVGHNKDRLNITSQQMHFSAAAAGDEDAMTLNQVCERAGIKVLKNPPSAGVFKPCETLAIEALSKLINRRGAQKSRQILEVLANAHMAPIAANYIKAVDAMMSEPEYSDVMPEDITTTLIRMGPDAERDAKVFAASHNIQTWRGLIVVLYKNTRKRRKVA